MRGDGLVVGIYGVGFLAADFVEVDSPNGDICSAIASPARINVGFSIHCRDVFVAIGCGYVSNRVDVGIAV